MVKAKNLFSDAQKASVAEAIRKVEENTSGELVVAVADASSEYAKGAGLFALLVTVAALCTSWRFRNMEYAFPVFAAFLVAAYQLAFALAQAFPAVKLLFTDKAEAERQVARAAAVAYQRFKISATVHSTGILVYVSLLERKVRVVGDGNIAAKLQDKDWQSICDTVTEGMKDARPADGLLKAIGAAGELLAANFPKKIGDTDELPNTLNIIEGIP